MRLWDGPPSGRAHPPMDRDLCRRLERNEFLLPTPQLRRKEERYEDGKSGMEGAFMAASGSAASMCAPLFRRTGPPTRGTAAFLPAPHGAPGRCGSGGRTCCARSCGRACWTWRPTLSPASTTLPPAISTGRTRSSWAFRPTPPQAHRQPVRRNPDGPVRPGAVRLSPGPGDRGPLLPVPQDPQRGGL